MTNKNIEMMKKIIEEKKNKSSKQNGMQRAEKSMGQQRQGKSSKKTGGLVDK